MNHLYQKVSKVVSGLFLLCLVLNLSHPIHAQQVTGLEGWTLFIDQGHAQKENMGLYNYSEAEKVLRVGLALKGMFIQQTDIDTVFTARLTDQDNISLEGRVALANTLATDFYYSIHSDAGPPAANSTLMLYGGWKSNGTLVEKTPEGGGAYGAILDEDLTGAMRIDKRGNYADRIYYQGDVAHHDNQQPYLYVNRMSSMASLLSEAGFHTNPTQQMRNMNAQWKDLEALSAFRSFLEWHGVDRPAIGVATGIVRDIETGLPMNDVTISVGDQTYVTDGYDSLFHKYTTNPEALRNGFYFIPGLEPDTTVQVLVSKEGYQSITDTLDIVSNPNGRTAENLSFYDPLMTSFTPAIVLLVEPSTELDNLIPGTKLTIHFSRKMDRVATQNAISFDPLAVAEYTWINDFVLEINTIQLAYLQDYTLTIDGDVAKNSLTDQFLDGDGDGTEGGNYILNFTTSDEDTDAPQLVDYSPSATTPARMLRPVIRLVYDEVIITESISDYTLSLISIDYSDTIQGVIDHQVVNEQSVLHFFPTEDLTAGKAYNLSVFEGLSDMFNNTTTFQQIQFYVVNEPITETTVIDNFNGGISGWWNPQQAGQTLGVITELTSRTHNVEVVNHSLGSTGSMKLSYGWDMDYVGTPYIRQHIPATASQNSIRFNVDDILQVYVFGDGSGNIVRMMIRDGLNHLESHQWVTLDWIGWKLISWDLSNDPAVGWVNGNGIIEGANFYMDGFHLAYADGGLAEGAVFFDQLHFVQKEQADYPTTLFENWQDYAGFTTNIFPWMTVDVKADSTWNPAGFTFPGSGDPYAFKVLNPIFTDPPIYEDHPAVDGGQYLIAMQSKTINEDKWLISPQLRATDISQLSFYAKSIDTLTYGPERIQVYISLDDSTSFEFNPENFTMISEGEYLDVPGVWTPYSYFLGEYSGQVYRFAIRYVSDDDYMLMLDKIEVDDAPVYALGIDVEPLEGGTAVGAGDYAHQQQVTIEAIPSVGYTFSHWADADGNELSQATKYTFAMPAEAITLVAHFEVGLYTLTLNILPEGAGTVSGAGSYPYNEEVTIEALPAENYRFVSWSNRGGDVISELAEYQFLMPGVNYQLTAVFEDVTAVDDNMLPSLVVYPNPAGDQLNISREVTFRSVWITDMSGRRIVAKQSSSHTLDVSALEEGFYILAIELGKRIVRTKIQITR